MQLGVSVEYLQLTTTRLSSKQKNKIKVSMKETRLLTSCKINEQTSAGAGAKPYKGRHCACAKPGHFPSLIYLNSELSRLCL